VGTGMKGTAPVNEAAAYSLEINSLGDIFLAGYYGGSNYAPANFGILKLNGNDGSKIYERTITDDTTRYSLSNLGIGSIIINDQPFFVGMMEPKEVVKGNNSLLNTYAVLSRIRSSDGKIIFTKKLQGMASFPSVTVKMIKAGDKMIRVSQRGYSIEVSSTNSDSSLYWNKLIRNYYLSKPFDASTSKSKGLICVLSRNGKETDISPYYSMNTDSTTLFILDSVGNLLNTYSTEYLNKGSYLLTSDDNYFYIKINTITFKFNDKEFVRYTDNIYLAPIGSYDNNQLLIAGSKIILMDKTTFSNKVVDTLNFTPTIISPIQNNIFYGSYSGSSLTVFVFAYDLTKNDTLWTRQVSDKASNILITNIQVTSEGFIYYSGYSANWDKIKVYKYQSSGSEIWKYTYQPTSLKVKINDVSFDEYSNSFYVVGTTTLTFPTMVY
jgi:hypothetical protein